MKPNKTSKISKTNLIYIDAYSGAYIPLIA